MQFHIALHTSLLTLRSSYILKFFCVCRKKNTKSLSASLIFAEARSPHIIKFSSLSLSHGFCANETRKRKKDDGSMPDRENNFLIFIVQPTTTMTRTKNTERPDKIKISMNFKWKRQQNVTERSCVSIRFDIRPFAKKKWEKSYDSQISISFDTFILCCWFLRFLLSCNVLVYNTTRDRRATPGNVFFFR